ncbi:hypothetical protein [Achromobacter aegrifaciens]|uniref:hypothetical protein n=1 Tax=Achromobacter aegrifaciens TaxID=1287736 RepID=UPI000F7439B2|nr:hypothetical protein [Achromobacter aegrifaciens]RSF02971.1 hypothetical protein EGU54_12035 [Achromobacter aegrifaciens]CAB3707690.1 hypothetical protein LMG26852_05545 [Achromobacter aegrifaciens]
MIGLRFSAPLAGFAPSREDGWRTVAMTKTLRLLMAGAVAVAAVGWRNVAAAQHLVTSGGEAGGSRPGVTALEALRLPAGSRRGLLGESIWLHGIPARVLVFDAPLSTAELIRYLSAQQPALVNLNVLSGQAILSGKVGQEQWVIQLEGLGSRRTAGSISAVSLLAVPESASPAWLPAGGRLRLDIALMEDGVRVSERIWQYPLPPGQLAAQLEQHLLRNGWRRMPVSEDSAHWWVRSGSRMRLSLVPLDGGTGLLVSGRVP